jgi:hypothetical protein
MFLILHQGEYPLASDTSLIIIPDENTCYNLLIEASQKVDDMKELQLSDLQENNFFNTGMTWTEIIEKLKKMNAFDEYHKP